MKNKIILSLICGILVLILTCGCGKENNTNFDDDNILNHLSVDEVKISELNTINDILNKFPNSQIIYVSVCYKGEEEENGCQSHSYEDLLTDAVPKTNISTLSFGIFATTKNAPIEIVFSTYYNTFKEKGKDSQYYSLELLESNGVLKLDKAYLELLPLDDIKKDYKIASRSNEYVYYIDFESKDGDKYDLTGYPSNSYIKIFNSSERDRNL